MKILKVIVDGGSLVFKYVDEEDLIVVKVSVATPLQLLIFIYIFKVSLD